MKTTRDVSKEKNPTFRSKKEYLAHREDIMTYAREVISCLQTYPRLLREDRQDLLQDVDLCLWRSRRKIPRAKGQKTYVRHAVFNCLINRLRKTRPYVLMVLAKDADIAKLLPKNKMRRVKNVPAGNGTSSGRAFIGRIPYPMLVKLMEDRLVVRLVPLYQGRVGDLAARPGEDGEDPADFLDTIGYADPWERVQAALDGETISSAVGRENPRGMATLRARVVQGFTLREAAPEVGFSVRTCQQDMSEVPSVAKRLFPDYCRQ